MLSDSVMLNTVAIGKGIDMSQNNRKVLVVGVFDSGAENRLGSPF